MSDVVVRPAVVEDAEGFVRAHESAWNGTIGALVGRSLADLAPFDERIARYRAGFDDPPSDSGVWVAEQDGVILAVAVRVGAELRDLFVVPEAWGSGVAQRLVNAVLTAIRDTGHEEAMLWVGEGNARAAVLRARRMGTNRRDASQPAWAVRAAIPPPPLTQS